jgi:glycine cleavage system H protein
MAMGDYLETTADKFIFRVKKGLLYSRDDVWIDVSEGGVTLGITDFFQRQGGDIIFIELPEMGRKVDRNDGVAQFESIKALFHVYSPIEGSITDVNSELMDRPELINEDPYGKGWILRLSPTNIERESKTLHAPEQYFELMKEKIQTELKKIKGF